MSVSVDTGGKGGEKSLNADLNLVPYIDLLTCMVAFLLITAVWTNLAQIKITPKGVGTESEQTLPTEPPVNISVLVAQDSHWIGLTTGDRRQIKKTGEGAEGYDYATLAQVLVTHGHGDHVAGVAAMAQRWPGASFAKLPGTGDADLGVPWEPLRDGQMVAAGDGSLWVVATPGHAPDHADGESDADRDGRRNRGS